MLISASSFAQTNFGLKAGVNIANQKWKSGESKISQDPNTSFHLLGFANVPMSSHISIQPGLGLSGKGFKLKVIVNQSGDEKTTTANGMYLEFPVNAVAKFKAGSLGKIFLGAGPYAAVGIIGQIKSEDGKMNYFGNEYLSVKRGDFGLNFLGGLEINNGLLFNVNYGLGLANITKSEYANYKAKNNVVSLSIGFNF